MKIYDIFDIKPGTRLKIQTGYMSLKPGDEVVAEKQTDRDYLWFIVNGNRHGGYHWRFRIGGRSGAEFAIVKKECMFDEDI